MPLMMRVVSIDVTSGNLTQPFILRKWRFALTMSAIIPVKPFDAGDDSRDVLLAHSEFNQCLFR
jgi:hypothetical protein